ncbi:MAG TPA: hypothetical protein VGK94_00470 [Candidatus Polarisedimenticolia bacterium]|jgi:hypothetical protein
MGDTAKIGFLVCPDEGLLGDFVLRPDRIEPGILRAVSKHLARCAPCREEVDRNRRGQEAAVNLRPWLSALLGMLALASAALVFLIYDLEGPLPVVTPLIHTGASPGGRLAPRLAALARFDPPSDPLVAAAIGGESSLASFGPSSPRPLSREDHRELAAARSRIDAGAWADAVGLLEDLCARHPARAGLRVLLAFCLARSGEMERAHWQYSLADDQGAGIEACWGRANALLRLGEFAAARRELAEHLLSRDPDHEPARELLGRISSVNPAGAR